jgi:4a-hydroxytetrahydrobiopterin dehydratase
VSEELSEKKCVPCEGGVARLGGGDLRKYAGLISGNWRIVDDHHLEREFGFADFLQALAFVNRVGEIAEQEKHHPDMSLSWGRVAITIWTHAIDGLSENDFILAAKIDQL